jgi:hypothetical protein
MRKNDSTSAAPQPRGFTWGIRASDLPAPLLPAARSALDGSSGDCGAAPRREGTKGSTAALPGGRAATS